MKLIITHPNGEQTPLVSKQNVSAVTKAEQTVGLLSDDIVNISVQSATAMQFVLGDTIEVYGKTYTLNQLPTIKKTGKRKFNYDLIFEGVQYELLDAQFLLPDNTVGDSFTGNLFSFLQILASNANRVFPGKWTFEEYPAETEYKTLTFTGDNCLSVLQRLCEEYGQEFEIIQTNGIRILNIKKAGKSFPFTFRYGRTGGLYEVNRQNINSKNVVTRLFVYGGSNNVQNNYLTARGSNKLCLPGKNKNTSYIQEDEPILNYGIKENTKIFDNIFPNRYGKVTSKGSNFYAFVDNTMDFDLNEIESDGLTTKWLIAGVPAKVHFNTGNLAGYEFDVHKYDHATKTIELIPFTDENGMKFPSETSAAFQFAPEDEYFFIDINLPQSYIEKAEAKLEAEATEYYAQNSQPQVQYGLTIDENFIKQFDGNLTVVNLFAAGDYIPVQDTDIGVDKSVRITGFTRDLLKPYKYAITLGDAVTKSAYVRMIAEQNETGRIIEINNLANPANARRNWRASQEVLSMVFDAEGDYYSDKIKPLSIETTMLQVGAKSMQFVLQNVIFEPNYQGNPNYVRVSSGNLIHYTIEETIRNWTIAAAEFSQLVSNTAYYIYARCQQSGNDAGNIILDTTQRKVNHESGYYTFLIGVLNSSIDNVRQISLTYGSTTINGRFIKTGRIESSGGSPTYFDLDNGEIGGNIKFTATDGSTKNVSSLDNVANETKDFINNKLPGILDGIQAQIDGQIEQFFYDYNPTTSNAPANTWTTTADKEAHLGDLFYNTSTGKVFRWIKNSSVYSWKELQDTDLANALSIANDAFDLAKTKRRIFTTQPVTPYETGDLWVQGASGDIMRCKTERLNGNYSSADWEKASNYTNDEALTYFINGSYSNTISVLTDQIDGKIECWSQDSDPSTAWTTSVIKSKHVGDIWYSVSTKLLKRYSITNAIYGWITIEDQKAIDAFGVATAAQNTADKKRQIFAIQPTPPYVVGDLWLRNWTDNGVDKKDLFRCITARQSGNSFNINDWSIAVYYDNTTTAINGGIVTSGTVQLVNGTSQSIVAGITGGENESAGTPEDKKVRIWAGASKENRATAPFRVLQDGSIVATKATIEGIIKAVSGSIGGFLIKQGIICGEKSGNTPPGINGSPAYNDIGLSLMESFIKYSDVNRWASIGSNVLPATFGTAAVGRFINETQNSGDTNYGLLISIKNAMNNIALAITGDISCNGAINEYPITTITPTINNTYIPGELTTPTMFRILAKFTNSNSSIGLPTRGSISSKLGISPTTPFAVKMTIICSADSTQTGYIRGRNTEVSGMNTTQYPQRLDNNAVVQTGGLGMARGDIGEFMLIWDGTNYYAYLLNYRN